MVAVVEPGERADETFIPNNVTFVKLRFMSYSLETVDVVCSEEAVEINGVFSAGSDGAHVLFSLADHGPLQQAGALQRQL